MQINQKCFNYAVPCKNTPPVWFYCVWPSECVSAGQVGVTALSAALGLLYQQQHLR